MNNVNVMYEHILVYTQSDSVQCVYSTEALTGLLARVVLAPTLEKSRAGCATAVLPAAQTVKDWTVYIHSTSTYIAL